MLKIEAVTLEEAYKNAATSLKCSVTELKVEVIQAPCKGFLGLFKKTAIIVVVREIREEVVVKEKHVVTPKKKIEKKKEKETAKRKPREEKAREEKPKKKKETEKEHRVFNDTIMPTSFVSIQDEEEEYEDVSNYLADYDEEDNFCEENASKNICKIVDTVKEEVNNLFALTCFDIDAVKVSVFNEETLLIEFTGADAALLIGKEGYRYKALSYMLFNWINTKYKVQLRLEIAEFLRNQEESVQKYLVGVCENIEKDGRAQTKILDGVLIQIALKELRDRYPDKYIVIRSTRDGLKYIIVNDYHSK
ncbi:Jag N-terminal domain-containing protein [Sulfurimonas sp. SAG-AH-194-I05]|nr:Jag N-terminal domain-containing protein [Sulfurimonas sp. SAG-AH-194-I05]MDF1874338.1 Jag N-terminal domain-containing protein [Sulfurimonas sp. SAG-AH-194-I05]